MARREVGVQLVAEQVVVNRAVPSLEPLFSHRPVSWMTPFLRLAGDEGEAAGLLALGERGARRRRPETAAPWHQLEAGPVVRDGDGLLVPFQWRTANYRTLFRLLSGNLRVRAVDGRAIVSIEGPFEVGPGAVRTRARANAARRAAESAVRGLLRHLRAALEDQVLPRGSP